MDKTAKQTPSGDDLLLEVKDLKRYFTISRGFFGRKKAVVKAVDGVSFHIKRGETFGLVGESGCGKSTIARTIIRLYKVTGGSVLFNGEDISRKKEKELKNFRKKTQMIFQDPYASLNTRMTVSDIVGEPLDIHNLSKGKERQKRIIHLLKEVGLSQEHASRYPHEFSGGQRQRIGIARSLAVDPDFIICDEPISALDVSIQAQVINMLQDLQKELGLTYLFIAHDLSMVKHISDRIGVMYLGKMVEESESRELYENPVHPYTRALLSSIPLPDPDLNAKVKREILEGDVPSPVDPPKGCRFYSRCRFAETICKEEEPLMKNIKEGHRVACHFSARFYKEQQEKNNG